uniref:Uncharacterized protein n=1 Tax=Kalanchoe fedtschenkoi TaxID=63787 RepID=A0A7N0UDV9_KALFE
MIVSMCLSVADSSRNIMKKILEMKLHRLQQIPSSIVFYTLKLLTCMYIILSSLGRLFSVSNSDKHLQRQTPPRQTSPQVADVTSQDQMSSQTSQDCWQRLQQLEEMVTELVKKPTKIPQEKDDMLLDSMNRIKSMEYDLQKTKRALIATASKQVELAETFENLKESSMHGTTSCWLRNRKSGPSRK